MYLRIDEECNPDRLYSGDVERIAKDAGVKVNWSRGRCQHGHTRDQTCIECEAGYVDDAHVFANVRGPVIVAASTDDNDAVVYVLDTPSNRSKMADVYPSAPYVPVAVW